MKHLLSAIFLAVFCLAISAQTNAVDVALQDLLALEKELMNSPLLEQEVEFDDSDDDDEAARKIHWVNPIKWIKNKLKNNCKCEEHRCECCFKLKFFGTRACLSAEQLIQDKKLEVKFSMQEKTLVDKKFALERKDEFCGSMPAPLGFLKFCFSSDMESDNAGTVTTCLAIDFRVGNTVGAVLQFKCLEWKNNSLSFGGFKKIEKKAMFTLKMKNPFKLAIAKYKKMMNKQ